MKTTILIAILALFMANNAKSEEITMSYQLIVYDRGKPLLYGEYRTLKQCLDVGSHFDDYTCAPVIREFAQ